MCFPAIGAALAPAASTGMQTLIGVSVVSGFAAPLVSYAGQRKQAKQQARYQAQAAAAERQRFMQEQTSLRMRQAQEQEAVGRELEQVSRKSQEALARARVSAGEAGVAGASVQALMDDYTRQEAGYRAALLRQQELGAIGTGLGIEQAGFATQQRQIGIARPIDRPSFLTAGLQSLSGGLGAIGTGYMIGERSGKQFNMVERVQVQGLGGQVPGISPTIQRGGQYAVQVQQAGRNKLMDLADALGQVNPMLQQYGEVRRLQQERQKSLEEALEKEGYVAYQTAPATMAVELKKTEQRIRAAAERGEIPDEANVARYMGALKAKAEVLANRDYRNILMNPEVLETTTDPIVVAAQQREEFLKRPEFQSAKIREHVFEHLEKVEKEFTDKVENRLAAFEVEEGKQNWLLNGKDSINYVINGDLDINDPVIKDWINHPAGIFKGSRKYAWDNLMKEELKEGLTSGNISPTKAKNFLNNLRKLDLGNGVKFADAEVGNAISDFYNYIEDQGAALEKRGADLANIEFDLLNNGLVDSLLESLGEGNNVSSVDARAIRESYLSSLPKGVSKEKAIDTFDKILGNVNKPANDATKLIVGKLDTFIDEGLELDVAVQEVEGAFRLGPSDGGITAQERNRLLKKIEDSRDFDRLIYKDDFYKNIITVDEELITGFVKERARYSPATYEVGYFTELGVPDDVPVDARSKDPRSVYTSILNKKGPSAAKAFVNRRYNAYEQQFRLAFKDRFDSYERSVSMTPEQAKERIREEAQDIRDKVFKQWERESIILANQNYGLSIPTSKFISPGVYE